MDSASHRYGRYGLPYGTGNCTWCACIESCIFFSIFIIYTTCCKKKYLHAFHIVPIESTSCRTWVSDGVMSNLEVYGVMRNSEVQGVMRNLDLLAVRNKLEFPGVNINRKKNNSIFFYDLHHLPRKKNYTT